MVANSPSGLLVWTAVVYVAATVTSAAASPAAMSPRDTSRPAALSIRSARGSSGSRSGSAVS